ncbi:hypothetical protein GGS23DRAFT_452623 [Durotheca rogersii]|uniref:uncharacterized protein n=1 Tax=Durotheca rogersii TaxID=419775 RepID=UPI00221F4675|nr:uncharacterized protein GGS23DRAFT_452623 [Durotheca rogersii]KAI5864551.1 hypothetical protein GGS23DRAFT_452623 [Durotheca rogersii]
MGFNPAHRSCAVARPKSILKSQAEQGHDCGQHESTLIKRRRPASNGTRLIVTFDEVARDLETGEHVPRSQRCRTDYVDSVARRRMWGLLDTFRQKERDNAARDQSGEFSVGDAGDATPDGGSSSWAMVLYQKDSDEDSETGSDEEQESDEEEEGKDEANHHPFTTTEPRNWLDKNHDSSEEPYQGDELSLNTDDGSGVFQMSEHEPDAIMP